MKPLKFPSLDGFHPIFQKAWDAVSADLLADIKKWICSKIVTEGLCEATIGLIPKVNSLETIKQFRPISLWNTLYNIVTKILVNRVKPSMPL